MDYQAVSAFFVGHFIGMAIGVGLGMAETRAQYRTDAIERGYAAYCPSNGEWAWKGECKE